MKHTPTWLTMIFSHHAVRDVVQTKFAAAVALAKGPGPVL